MERVVAKVTRNGSPGRNRDPAGAGLSMAARTRASEELSALRALVHPRLAGRVRAEESHGEKEAPEGTDFASRHTAW